MFDEIKTFSEGLENKRNRCERIKNTVREKIIEISDDKASLKSSNPYMTSETK